MKSKTISLPFLTTPEDPEGALLPDIFQIQISIAAYQEELVTGDAKRKEDIELLLKSLELRKKRLTEFLRKAREQDKIVDKMYTIHQYTTNERIEARSEASSIVDGQIQFEEPVYRRELVRRVVKDIPDPGGMAASLVDRLYFEAVRMSEPSDEEIFFIAGLDQTSEKASRSKKDSPV